MLHVSAYERAYFGLSRMTDAVHAAADLSQLAPMLRPENFQPSICSNGSLPRDDECARLSFCNCIIIMLKRVALPSSSFNDAAPAGSSPLGQPSSAQSSQSKTSQGADANIPMSNTPSTTSSAASSQESSSAPSNSTASTGQTALGNSASTGCPNPSSSCSTGELVGSIVGTAIAVALITAALTWLALRKRTRRQPTRIIARNEKQPSQELEGGAGGAGWERHLPQATDDRTMEKAFSTLINQVEVHVENHYRDGRRGDGEDEAALRSVGSPYLPGELPALMQHTNRPIALIKHCLTHVVLDPDRFLPPYMTMLLHVPQNSNRPGTPSAAHVTHTADTQLQPCRRRSHVAECF